MSKAHRPIAPDKNAPAPPAGTWMSIEEAAAFLSMPVRVLRETLARKARTDGESVEARMDGIIARKLGRRWKVWLGGKWTAPQIVDHPSPSRVRMPAAESTGHGGEVPHHGRT